METSANIGSAYWLHPSYKGASESIDKPLIDKESIRKAFKHGSVQKAQVKKAKRLVNKRYSQRQFLNVAKSFDNPDEIKLEFTLKLV